MRVKLKDAFNLQMGKTPSRADLSLWGGNNKWISIADIGSAKKHISSTKECITDEGVLRSGIKVVPEGTVIMSFKLSIGKTAIVSEDMYTNEAIMAFIDNGTYCIDPNYLYHLCCGTDWTQGGNKAVMGLTLNKATLSEMEIELPTLEEQREIASILDQLDAIIEKRHDELNMIEQLVKSRFIELFGDVIHNSKAWQMRLFADIASSRLGKMLDAKQQTGKCSYPYLANFNVQWFRFNIENLNQMDFDEDDRAEFELKDGDLLVCEGGEIGRCAVWHNEIQPCFFQKALHRVRCNRQIIQPDYLAWWFKYNCDHDGFAAIAGAKATIAHLPGVKLKQLQVAVPPIELQQQFAAFVEQTDKSKYFACQTLSFLLKLANNLQSWREKQYDY